MSASRTLWQTGTWLHYNYTNADVLQNMVSEKRIKTSKSLFNDALSPLEPLLATQLCLYHSLQSNAQLTLVGLSDINVPNPANYVGQRMTMTRNGSNHLHTRICRFWAGWILADIKYTTCPIQQICSVRSLEKRRWRDSWLELSMSQKRLVNLKDLMNVCSLYKIFRQKRPSVRKLLLQILQGIPPHLLHKTAPQSKIFWKKLIAAQVRDPWRNVYSVSIWISQFGFRTNDVNSSNHIASCQSSCRYQSLGLFLKQSSLKFQVCREKPVELQLNRPVLHCQCPILEPSAMGSAW
jgi:hypothetical protein